MAWQSLTAGFFSAPAFRDDEFNRPMSDGDDNQTKPVFLI